MTSQKIEQEVVQQGEGISTVESVEEYLPLLLQRLPDYFHGRAQREDVDTLVFCLQHLYNSIDTLYMHNLPTLTRLTDQTQKHASPSTFAYRHAIWEGVQAILLILERVESHCHLLLSTTTSVLASLDTTGDTLNIDGSLKYVGTEQWQYAYEVLSQALHNWQDKRASHLTFATAFASTPVSGLTSVDVALALLFDSANAIFGDIIPDMQLVAQGDDEVVATLLFDLMQQNDLLLVQISKLVEPLQQLMKHYAVKE